MARNSVADMVMEASDVEGATSGTGGVAGVGAIGVASSIGGARVVSIDSMGCSSYYASSAYGGSTTGTK